MRRAPAANDRDTAEPEHHKRMLNEDVIVATGQLLAAHSHRHRMTRVAG